MYIKFEELKWNHLRVTSDQKYQISKGSSSNNSGMDHQLQPLLPGDPKTHQQHVTGGSI